MADLSSLKFGGMPVGGYASAAGTLFSVFGQLQQGKAAEIEGKMQQQAADFNAWQSEREAGVAIAISQRQAEEERRQGRFAASRALAVAAASGGGVSDPTIVRLISETKGVAAYRASVALYQGEDRARQLRLQGVIGRFEGANAAAAGSEKAMGLAISAGATGLKGAMNLFDKYGGGGPKAHGDAALLNPGDGANDFTP